jgi:hypothetical protein
MAHPFGNDPSKIDGYRNFWKRKPAKRPLVGFSFKSWFPLQEFKASAKWQSSEYLTPDMVDPDSFLDDQERLLKEGETLDDDILRGASPSQAVPWLCAMLGGTLKILPGSILTEERCIEWEQLEGISLDHENLWFQKYMACAVALADRSNGRFPVSHGTLVGPSDLAGALRGHGQSIIDLVVEPDRSKKLLGRMNAVFQEVTDELWKRVPLFHEGYYDAQYQLWAPGPIIRMQEDATALYSPDHYREFLQTLDRETARRYQCAFMHLHSTSMFLLDAFLDIEEIGCFEINHDVSGPPLSEMIPYFASVQKADRSLLIRGSVSPEELTILTESLDPAGLYLYIMVDTMEEVKSLKQTLRM